MTLSLRQATLEDCKELSKIDAQCREHSWSEGQWKSEIGETSSSLYVSTESGSITVVISGRILGEDAELFLVLVKPDVQNQGMATKGLIAWFDQLEKSEVTQVFLEVSEQNLAARKVYDRLGFKQIGLRKKYYQDGSNAILMQRKLAKCS